MKNRYFESLSEAYAATLAESVMKSHESYRQFMSKLPDNADKSKLEKNLALKFPEPKVMAPEDEQENEAKEEPVKSDLPRKKKDDF